jgi:hypothetical protein
MAIALSIAYTATPLPAGSKLIIEATKGMSAGRSFVPRSEYRQIQVSAAAAASPANILAAYTAKFGALVAGQRIFLRLTVLTSSGLRGVPVETSVVVG